MWLVAAIALACVLVLRQGAHVLILRGLRAPRLAHQRTPADIGLTAQTVRLAAAKGKTLFAWFVPVPGLASSPAVVVMHGWGSNASLMLPALAPLHEAGFAVLLIDARCHGLSDDEPFTSLPRFAEDIETGLDWLHQQANIDPRRLAVMGHSVGAGAALLCASRRHDVRAVVSLNAFAHPREIMRQFLAEARIPYPVLGWYVMRHVQAVIEARFDDIAPLASMARLDCPVLLVHGIDDSVVPFGDAARLMAAGSPGLVRSIAVNGGHDPSEALVNHLTALTTFLTQAFLTTSPRRTSTHGKPTTMKSENS